MYYVRSDELMHYGVMGMHWGERRYQNEDGSYKPGAEGRYAPKGVNGGSRSHGRGGIYGINERYYSNRANNLSARASRSSSMASANRRARASAKTGIGRAIYGVNERYYANRASKLEARAKKNSTMASVNRSAAENRAASKSSKKKRSPEKSAKKAIKKSVTDSKEERQRKASNGSKAATKIVGSKGSTKTSGIYGVNERYYSKKASKLSGQANRNSTMASMNRDARASAKTGIGRAIYGVNERYYQRRADRQSARAQRNATMASMNRSAGRRKNR